MFQGSLNGVSKVFQSYFKAVSIVLQGCWVVQDCHMEVSMVFGGVSQVFQGYCKDFLRGILGCFEN